MNAQAYLETFIRREYVGDCHVILQHAKRGVSVRMKLDAEVPDGDDEYDVFIQCLPLSTQRTDVTQPEVIVDTPTEDNCNEKGETCADHPDQGAGHSECYGAPVYCTFEGCTKAEEYAAEHAEDEEEEDVGHEASDSVETQDEE